jgi:carboxyl-terminal processing protease
MNRILRVVIVVLVVLVITGTAFAGGFVVGHGSSSGAVPPVTALTNPHDGDLEDTVDEVQSLIDRQALKPTSEESMTAGAISGMLEALDDPYSAYFDPKHFKFFNEQMEGSFEGIGVTIAEKDGIVSVVEVFAGSPAKRAGMKPKDEFVSIGGITKKKWALEEAVSRVKGPAGTTVKITVRRPGEKQPVAFDIKRAKITIPVIMSEMIGKDIGYIRLMTFNQQSADEVRGALKSLKKKGAKGYVLDLRDNPGGGLQDSIRVSSLFIKDGNIVTVDSRNSPEEVFRAVPGGFETDRPLVVLVNENSASASEIVAGALQDYDRAPLVGVKTFGRGSVQNVEAISTGGAVKLTTARYLTPKGRSLHGKGLNPDVVVKMKVENQADRKKDVQLKKAIELLTGILN